MSSRYLPDGAAAIFALTLAGYSVSDGNGGHALVQVVLILAGATLVFEGLLDLLDQLMDEGR